jgi:hypothetical protein
VVDVLSKFPKSRPNLPEDYQTIYDGEYLRNRNAVGLVSNVVSRLEAWMHKQVARESLFPLLELGAGTLNHVPY